MFFGKSYRRFYGALSRFGVYAEYEGSGNSLQEIQNRSLYFNVDWENLKLTISWRFLRWFSRRSKSET